MAPFERGEIGPDLFDAACKMGLEGLVSKHRGRRYRPRTCDWIKVKNRTSTRRSAVSSTSSKTQREALATHGRPRFQSFVVTSSARYAGSVANWIARSFRWGG